MAHPEGRSDGLAFAHNLDARLVAVEQARHSYADALQRYESYRDEMGMGLAQDILEVSLSEPERAELTRLAHAYEAAYRFWMHEVQRLSQTIISGSGSSSDGTGRPGTPSSQRRRPLSR